jgi:glycosyltransferase involved in cell wall biosynthesis
MAGARRGGAETFFVSLVLALHRAGVEQRVVIRRDAARAALLAAGGVAPVELGFGGLLDFFTAGRLARLAAAYRPAVAVAWMSRAAAVLPAGPFVRVGRLGGYYDLKYYSRCDHLVCNTRDIARYCRDGGWPQDRVHYLPNFVAPRRLAPADRAAFTTPTDTPLLLAMGRLHRNKAFDVLLAAVAALPGVWLWIAGEGEEQAALTALAGRLGVADRVRFLGWRDDREALLAAADVCVVPSRVEPFGNVILDAWSAGKPLVAADAAGPAAYIEPDVNGLLTPIDDSAALAAAIQRLLRDASLSRRLAAGGTAAWQKDFSETAAVRNWRNFFATVTHAAAAAAKVAT